MQLEIPITDEINMLFGTPVMMIDVPDAAALNAGLLEEMAPVRATGQGPRGSNIGGWQSHHEFWQWPGPAAAKLRHAIQMAIKSVGALSTDETDMSKVEVEYRIRAWANVNGVGDYNARHSFPQFDWAMVYFVACGQPDPRRPMAGKLELHDPRHLAELSPLRGFGFSGSLLLDPIPGKLLLFPAWLEQSVHPWHGTGERIWVGAIAKMTGGRHAGLR